MKRQIGVRDFINVDNSPPPLPMIGRVISRMCNDHSMWWKCGKNWVIHNSGMDNRRMLKICMFIGFIIYRQRSRSSEIWTQKHEIYAPNVIRYWKYSHLI